MVDWLNEDLPDFGGIGAPSLEHPSWCGRTVLADGSRARCPAHTIKGELQ